MRILLPALLLAAACGAADPREEAASRCRGHYDRLWRWITARGEAPATEAEMREAAGIRDLDPWGHAYEVERRDDGGVRVWSNGPDGEPGTDDDIAYPP